jgi:hypothetical protein
MILGSKMRRIGYTPTVFARAAKKRAYGIRKWKSA